MNERRELGRELDDLQQQMKDLEILYEQYFAGIERREPYRQRTEMAKRLRIYTNRRIVWTDLKFRYHGLASRFMSYCQYWDRILRLIEEGKYHRHTAKLGLPTPPAAGDEAPKNLQRDDVERLHHELSEARRSLGLGGDAPSPSKIAAFIDGQREQIRDRYGDRPVQFSVDTSGGKPRIKVSLKK